MNSQINSLSLPHIRGRFEIISALIIIAQQSVTLSKFIYSLGLSHETVKAYLQLMLESGLISNRTVIKGKKKHNHSAYLATKKGKRFLKLYCTNLYLLYEDNLQDSLDKHLLQYCMNNKTTLMSNLPYKF